MGRGWRSGPGPDSALVGGVAVGTFCWEGDGSGEGIRLTADWGGGMTLPKGMIGAGGGGIGFPDVRLEPLREWAEEPGSVLMSGIMFETAGGWLCELPSWR